MSDTEEKRPRSFIEEEDIVVKPSTELIPDEYERDANENMLVELISRQREDEEANYLANCLSKLSFSVNRTNVSKVITNDTWISNFINTVKKKIEENPYDGLLLVFAKLELRPEQMQSIWASFTASNCTALKDKPKIFIFQDLKRGSTTTDSLSSLQTDLDAAYDTPSEADILIVYDKYSQADCSSDFLENFGQNIKAFGNKEDLINIVSLCIGSASRPLVISTMTRKFFFTVNQYRGHHQNILENQAEIKKTLEQIKEQIQNSSKPKEKPGIMSRIGKGLKESFRSKNHRVENQNSENRIKENITNIKHDEDNENKDTAKSPKKKPEDLKPLAVDTGPPAGKSPTRKTSTSSITVTPRNSTRSRLPSGTFSSKEDVTKKPPWK